MPARTVISLAADSRIPRTDRYGRSAELLGAYLRERGGSRGEGDWRDAAVRLEATPDTAGVHDPQGVYTASALQKRSAC